MEKRKQEMDPMLPPASRQPSMDTILLEHCDAFESLDMENFLTDPWSVEETNTSAATSSTAADPNATTLIHRQGSPTLSLPMPVHRKIVDKVWAKMRKERLPLMMDVQGEAQRVHELDALPLSSSPSPCEIAASPMEVKGTTAGLGPCNGEGMEWERGGRGKKGMNEMEEKAIERRMKRLMKSRESAARFHAKKQAYTRELEAKVKQLREENARLQEEERKNWARMNDLVQMLYETMDEQARNNGQKTVCTPRRHNSCPCVVVRCHPSSPAPVLP